MASFKAARKALLLTYDDGTIDDEVEAELEHSGKKVKLMYKNNFSETDTLPSKR